MSTNGAFIMMPIKDVIQAWNEQRSYLRRFLQVVWCDDHNLESHMATISKDGKEKKYAVAVCKTCRYIPFTMGALQ